MLLLSVEDLGWEDCSFWRGEEEDYFQKRGQRTGMVVFQKQWSHGCGMCLKVSSQYLCKAVFLTNFCCSLDQLGFCMIFCMSGWLFFLSPMWSFFSGDKGEASSETERTWRRWSCTPLQLLLMGGWEGELHNIFKKLRKKGSWSRSW